MSVVPQFTFSKLWTDASKFPTVETREIQVREDMQALFDEIKSYINNTLVTDGSGGAGVLDAANLPFSSTRSAFSNITTIKDALEKVLDIAQQVVELSIGEGAVAHANLQSNAVWANNILDGAVTLTSKVSGVLPLANGGLGVDASTADGKGTARNNLGLGVLATYTSANTIPLTMGGLAVDLSSDAGKVTARANIGLGSCATESTLPLSKGGTGAQDASSARSNLGLGSCAVESVLPVAKGGTGVTSLQSLRNNAGLGNTTGALPVANGGTGADNAASARSNIGAQQQCSAVTTSAVTVTSSGTWVTCSGVTGSNHLVVTPHPSYHSNWQNANVRCTSQTTNAIYLISDSSTTVAANVLIFN